MGPLVNQSLFFFYGYKFQGEFYVTSEHSSHGSPESKLQPSLLIKHFKMRGKAAWQRNSSLLGFFSGT